MTDRVGQKIGNYRLVRLLGQGGFAEVYLAEHIYLGSFAAIKLLYVRVAQEDIAQFQQEGRMLAALEHPHIVRVLDFGIEDSTPYLVMSYAPGGTLRTRHPKGSRVPLPTIVEYVKQVAQALQYAHDHKFIHRDIKPENMLISREGKILLSDFGIAVISRSERSSLNSLVGTGGTPSYMAPELFQGKPRTASDQYSLGVVVYEWLCGTPPFPEGNAYQLGYQHIHESVTPLRQHVPTLSPAVEDVVIVNSVAWSPDGTRIASGGWDGTVQVWNANDGSQPFTYRGHSSSVSSVAWSPDSTRLASGSLDRTVQVWNAHDGNQLFTYGGHSIG